jgi:hypothetical protein
MLTGCWQSKQRDTAIVCIMPCPWASEVIQLYAQHETIMPGWGLTLRVHAATGS